MTKNTDKPGRPSPTANAPARKRGRPKREDVAAIEEKLLAISLQEFLDHGYGGASLTRIVRQAGISKTTLYSRFADKESLFRAIMNRQIVQFSPASILGPGQDRPDLEAGLTGYANHMLQASLGGDLLGVNRLIYSESHRFPELGRAAAERTERGIGQIAAFIQDCARADNVPCEHARGVAEVFILTIRGWYINVMLTNEKVPKARREQWVKRAVHTLLAAREEW